MWLTDSKARASHWRHALVLSEAALEPDLVLVTSRLSALEKGSAWGEAVEALALLRHGLRPGVFGLNSVLSASANATRWLQALALLHSWGEADLISCNAVLTGLSRSACWRFALVSESWQQHSLRTQNTSDGLLRCNNVVSTACGQGSRWERAVWLMMSDLGSRALRPDAVSLRSTLSALERGMSWSLAMRAISYQLLQVGVAGVNSAISACRSAHAWADALQLMSKIRQSTLRPTLVSWAATVSACSGQWAACCSLLSNVEASEVSVGAASEACASGGEWLKSLGLLMDSTAFSLRLDSMTWDGLVSACHSQVLWSQALSILSRMEDTSPVALEATISALSQSDARRAWGAVPAVLFLARGVGLRWLSRRALWLLVRLMSLAVSSWDHFLSRRSFDV